MSDASSKLNTHLVQGEVAVDAFFFFTALGYETPLWGSHTVVCEGNTNE